MELFNHDVFEEYFDLAVRCTKTAKESTTTDGKAKALGMVTKIRELMDSEVDHSEATKDGSNILT